MAELVCCSFLHLIGSWSVGLVPWESVVGIMVYVYSWVLEHDSAHYDVWTRHRDCALSCWYCHGMGFGDYGKVHILEMCPFGPTMPHWCFQFFLVVVLWSLGFQLQRALILMSHSLREHLDLE